MKQHLGFRRNKVLDFLPEIDVGQCIACELWVRHCPTGTPAIAHNRSVPEVNKDAAAHSLVH